MNDEQKNIAKRCFDGTYGNTISFPETIKTLMEDGFEGYIVDFRGGKSTYYLLEGSCVTLDHQASSAQVAERFDEKGVATLIKWAQSNAPDYSYKGFCQQVKTCGCAGYIVSFLGRRIVYFGRTAETHVEHFPN
jgi:uncharacterized protein YbcV (DUF1398 family)